MEDSLRDSLEEIPNPNQGRIVTQNPALLAMLQENSMEKPVRRVYVDSPVMSETDDDRYRYISTNVDDFDEDQELALKDAESARHSPQYNYRDNIAFKQRQASQESRRHTGTGTLDGERYEDRNMRTGSYSSDKEDLVPETQYVVRNKSLASRNGSGTSKLSERSQHHIITPIRSPLKHRHIEEEDDRELLQEAEYQKQLLEKITEQSQAAESIHIPKLDLVDSDDERGPRDSLEFNGGRIGSDRSEDPRDSLDETDAQPYRNDPDYGEYKPNITQGYEQDPETGLPHNQMQPRIGYANQFNNPIQGQEMQQPFALQNQPQNQLLQQQQLQLLQQQMLQQGQLVQQPLMYPQQPFMLVQNPQMMYQQPQLLPQPYNIIQQPLMAQQGQQQVMVHQAPHSGRLNQQPHHEQQLQEADQMYYQQDQQETDESAFYEQYEQEMQQNIAEQEAYQQEQDNKENHREEDVDRRIAKPVPVEVKPNVDYVGLNKKQLKKEKNTGSYGQKFVKRKVEKDTNAAPVPLPRTTVPAKPRVSPKASSAGPAIGEVDTDDQTMAEQVWAARSQHLTQQKVEKAGPRKPKPGSIYKGPLKKYASESGVNDMRQPPGVPQGFKPHHVPAFDSPGGGPSHSAGSVWSEGVVPSRAQDTPLRHTVVTEDGQKVSVDINLKLISPPPPNKVLAPLGPHNQHLQSQRPIQKPAQRPIQAFQDYEQGEEYNEYMTSPPYQSPSPVGSPYRVLPPIGSADSNQGRVGHIQYQGQGIPPREPRQQPAKHYESPRGDNHGSYMEQFQKNKNKSHDYKVYTVNDYRKMKKEVRLGGLGPDLDSETLRERKEKVQKQQEYARQANERNKQMPRKAPQPVEEEPAESEDLLHRRKVALEYARSVPKPKPGKPKPTSTAPAVQSAPSRNNQYSPPKPVRQDNHKALQVVSAGTERELELVDLQKLQARHEQERQQVAFIKQNMQQPV